MGLAADAEQAVGRAIALCKEALARPGRSADRQLEVRAK
jgi:hypothetical protein